MADVEEVKKEETAADKGSQKVEEVQKAAKGKNKGRKNKTKTTPAKAQAEATAEATPTTDEEDQDQDTFEDANEPTAVSEDVAEPATVEPSEVAEIAEAGAVEPSAPIELKDEEPLAEVDLKDEEPVKSAQPASTPLPAKPRPLSQRFMSRPHERSRSNSPARFPIKIDDSNRTPREMSPAPELGRITPSKRLSNDVQSVIASTTTNDDEPLASPPAESSSPPQSGGMFRKASSGLGGFLERMGSMRKSALSPPGRAGSGLDRRNTGNSSMDASTRSALAAIRDESEDARPSLQDRFKTLREQEEQHDLDTLEGGEGTESRQSKDGEDEGESTSTVQEQTVRTKRASSSLSQAKTPLVNADLPPGTASGMSVGPAKDQSPVNWDLWQAVVYEGPVAVTRTSGEELSRAIASGIPAAIRGVVWQVLADSKSEELEQLYRTLKTRGSEPEAAQSPSLARKDSEPSQGTAPPPVPEKDETTSSRSSVHSTASSEHADSSTTTTTPPASVEGNTAELQNKLLAEKQKREAAALQKLEKAIKRDLGSRTSYSKYTQSAGLQDGLFGVCKAYALFDTNVGYAQGINFIAMPLLFNMPEEEAFTLLVRMMHHFQLRTLFEPEMPGLHLRLYQFERVLEDFEPALFCHLKRRHVSPELYATQWFLTLFAYRFPLQLVLRIYDLLFSEGLTAIMKFGIVLMQKNKDALLAMKDMSQLTTFLKEKLFDAYIDKSPSASSLLDSGFFGSVTGGADKELYRADELVRDATQITIPQESLNAYEVEWDELRRVDREREAELENLKTTNSTLLTKVKTLEERVQQHDTEHVNIASDLVKFKVENDTLHDAKEALEMQVQELQKMVDAQPAEIEEKLKAEMDRIMQRNMEVQNENRHLQDELDNTEQQLVRMSMTHAETQADFDTLKQKWSGLQAMMNGK